MIVEAFIPLLMQEIAKLPCKANTKPSSSTMLALIGDTEAQDAIIVEKTFLNTLPKKKRRAESVTASSSEAHHVMNPRRSIASAFDL